MRPPPRQIGSVPTNPQRSQSPSHIIGIDHGGPKKKEIYPERMLWALAVGVCNIATLRLFDVLLVPSGPTHRFGGGGMSYLDDH